MCAGLIETPGLYCSFDEVEHIVAHLNVVWWEYPRWADLDRALISRLVVGFSERNANRDPLRHKEIHLHAARTGPVRQLGGVAARRLQIAPPCGQDPEKTQEMVAKQFPTLGLLGHCQAVRPDPVRLLPMPGGHQIEHHHAPHRHGVDRGTVTADLLVGLVERDAEVGHDVNAVRGESQLHDPARFLQRQSVHILAKNRAHVAGGGCDVGDTRSVQQDYRIHPCVDFRYGVIGLLSKPGVVGIVGDRQQQINQPVDRLVVKGVGPFQCAQHAPVG